MSTAAILYSIAALLLAEAFFALSEVTLISASRERLRARADAGSRASAKAIDLLARPERILATTLTATNLCLVGSSFAANETAARLLGPERSAWAIVALAPVILLFGELLPKMLARRHADALAPVVAYPVRAAMTLLSPIVSAAGGLSRAIVGSIKGSSAPDPFVTKEEIRAILRAERRAALDPEEAGLISRLLGMAGAKVREVMTPLPDVVAISAAAPVSEAVEMIRRHGYSRLPVFQDRTDNIVGIIHAMDLIQSRAAGAPLQAFLKRAFYVPEAGRLDQVLDEFRRRGQEMAVAVDEFGAASGIVTMEDVLEELVGEILDEFDRPRRDRLEPAGAGAHVADGSLPLGDLGEALGVTFPRAGYETLAGFIAFKLQRIPKVGDTVEFGDLRLTVTEAGDRRVRKVRIERSASS
jgi:magnesium and cobalt exporter, CNNM family